MVATIMDVARLAGVARSTVSNVMNRPEIVAPATRKRVLDAMEMLGFVPNESARVLAGGMGRFIGIVVHDASNPFFAQMARTVEDIALDLKYVVTLTSTDADPIREENALGLLIQQRAQGVLITPSALGADAISRLRRIGARVVLLDVPGGEDECSVSVDDVHGGKLAGDHFLAMGYRRFAFVGSPDRTVQHRDRLAGFREALEASEGMPSVRVVAVGHEDVVSGKDAARQIAAAAHDGPLAVLTGNDLIAIGLMFGLQEQGISVPEQVAICGYDDIDLARYLATPLTTVRQPMEQMGRTAFELLLDEIGGQGHVHRSMRFTPELAVRDSTRSVS